MRILNKIMLAIWFPKSCDSTSPMIDIEHDYILIAIYIDFFTIYLHREDRREI